MENFKSRLQFCLGGNNVELRLETSTTKKAFHRPCSLSLSVCLCFSITKLARPFVLHEHISRVVWIARNYFSNF